jgi:flagellar hook-basal body complex protein FliE
MIKNISKKNLFFCYLFNCIVFIIFFSTCIAFSGNELFMPNEAFYPNPYSLMTENTIESFKGHDWYVYSNKKRAEILNENGQLLRHTKYLERFKAVERVNSFLKVISVNDNSEAGWIDMRDLILLGRPIKNEYSVLQKVFLKVKLKEAANSAAGINSLRFRDGPGEPNKEDYKYLIKKDEINKVSSLFFYIYGVHFNDEKKNEDIINSRYININIFKDADYFLIGQQVSLSPEDIKRSATEKNKAIRGWIPRSSVVLWDNRQALQDIKSEHRDAHKFKYYDNLLKYFKFSSDKKREHFITELVNNKDADKDIGAGNPKSGQALRYLVLFPEKLDEIQYAYIGYTGEHQGIAKQQETLGKIQEGFNYLDIFFLIDATKSMGIPIKAAANVVNNLITSFKKDKSISLKLNAAVYRDESEKSRVYDEWDKRKNRNLADWLANVKAKSKSSDDYQEALFTGIKRALSGWNFSHDFSTRILIILGDAGDNGRGGLNVSSVANLLEEKNVLPLSIHFNHALHRIKNSKEAVCDDAKLRSYSKDYRSSKERMAMCSYIEQMEKLNRHFYHKTPELINIPSMKGDDFEKRLKVSVEDIVKKAKNSIESIRAVRQGQKSLSEVYKETEKTSSSITAGLFMAQMEMLRKKHPELADIITKRPELGFVNAYIGIKEKKHDITRPVLLLSAGELGRIISSIEAVTQYHRSCNPEIKDKILKQAMAIIVGELLQVNPHSITDEEVRNWFNIAIPDDRTYVGTFDILETMCNNPELWAGFLKKLEKARHFLNRLLSERPEDRIYRDINTLSYFWIYPEEIFPTVK